MELGAMISGKLGHSYNDGWCDLSSVNSEENTGMPALQFSRVFGEHHNL